MFWKHFWAQAHAGHPCGGWSHGRACGDSDSRMSGDADSAGGPLRGAAMLFGVRRPLRFMARQLELSEEQIAQLAAIIDDLKTERAQARVDDRRAVAAFADALLGESFGLDAARKAAEERADSARKVEEAVVKALHKTYGLLEPEQRKKLAYMLRAGTLSI